MSADLGLATRLRNAGLKVREVNGWKTRANSSGVNAFRPKGGVNHHTAGPPKSSSSSLVPSLGIIINGRSDLPGPLANVYLGYDDVFYVVAAGPANHAGLPDGGVCRGMHGNSEAWGMEIEHPGTSPLPKARVLLAARAWAAILQRGDLPASQLVQHREFAPSRKPDLASNMGATDTPWPGADGFRQLIRVEQRKLEKVTLWKVSYLTREKDDDGRFVRKPDGRAKDPAAWTKANPGAFQRGRVYFTPAKRG